MSKRFFDVTAWSGACVSVVVLLLAGWVGEAGAFPMKRVYWGGATGGGACAGEYGQCYDFETPLAACVAGLTSYGLTGINVTSTEFPPGQYQCTANDPFGTNPPCDNSGNTCFAPYHASIVDTCPSNSVPSPAAGGCTVSTDPNPNLVQLNNTASGGENNGPPCPSCANPVNPSNGNKYEEQLIYRGGKSLDLTLSFNTFDDFIFGFGQHWRGSYERWVRPDGANVVVYRSDGRGQRFVPSGGGWAPAFNTNDKLVELQSPPGTRTGWELTTAEADELETYNAAGVLQSIRTRSGLIQTLTYSDGTSGANGGFVLDASGNPTTAVLSAGLLIRVTDPFGRVLAFGYNQNSRVVKVTDPAGGVYLFAYSFVSHLQSIQYPGGAVRSYVYNEPANTGGASLQDVLTGIVDENGARFATFKYDSIRRIVQSEHAGGVERYQFTYGSGFSPTSTVTDPFNVTRSYVFQTVRRSFKNTSITGSVCPACGPAAQSFDANGNVATRTDWNANRTNYAYDLTRNLETSRTEALTSGGSSTAQTRTITTQWHATFRLPTKIAEPLRITTLTYDATGSTCGAKAALCSRSIQATTDTNGSSGFSGTPTGSPRAWSYTYNANGDVLTIDGPRTDVTDTTTYTYYANNDTDPNKRGNVATITNAAGHVASITAYNAHGQPLTIVDANGLTTTLTYDTRLRLKTQSSLGETTTYDYDGVGQLTKVTLPDGSFLAYTFDNAHRLTAIEDNLGNRIAYTLDAMGNRTLEEVRDPAKALVQTRSRVYSTLNRLFQELGAAKQTTEYGYDNQGNVLTVKDPLNHTTTNQYDALNRLKQVTSPTPVSALTQYAYNGLDQLVSVTDPRTLATTYTVNGLGNLTQQSSPDTGVTVNTQDAAGNLLTQVDAKSQTTTYAYDTLNRVTSATFHDGSKHLYAYDSGTNGKDRLTGITEQDPSLATVATIAFGYDQKGRLTSDARSVNAVNYSIGYRFDSSGRMDRISYPSGRTVDYSFDALGRISAVTTTPSGGAAQDIASSVTYHPFGGVKGFTFGNSQTYARVYDQDGRIASYTLAGMSVTVGYDAASRITAIGANTYAYDNLDRLTSATLPSTGFGYTYDAVGNRLTRVEGANTDTYTYATASNRIATLTPSGSSARTFAFDPNGSTTSDGLNNYTFDARGRMVRAVSSFATDYYVNALGQRVRKTNSTEDKVFHYDSTGHLLAESDAMGTILKEYVWLGDVPVAAVDGANRSYIHVDHLNTPRLTENQSAQTVWRWDQAEPFGVNVPDENPSGLGVFEYPGRFAGQYFDKETGLAQNWYREYWSEGGRYIQSDPAGLIAGLNTYVYVAANPLGASDPTGENPLIFFASAVVRLYNWISQDIKRQLKPPAPPEPPSSKMMSTSCVAGRPTPNDCYERCKHLLPSPSGDLQASEYRKCYRECVGSL